MLVSEIFKKIVLLLVSFINWLPALDTPLDVLFLPLNVSSHDDMH